MKVSVLRAFARHGVRLAVSFVLLIGVAEVCHAQAAGASAHPAKNAATPAAPAAVPANSPSAEQTAAQGERKPGGNHEGIQVHGHWVIEVRNPDGTVTARREFENSIQPYGMFFLASVMAGNNASGGLSVLLNGASTNFGTGSNFSASPTFGETGPCDVAESAGLGGITFSQGGTCLITTGTSGNGMVSFLGNYCEVVQQFYATANGQSSVSNVPCSTNLTVAAPAFTSANEITGVSGTTVEVQLSGSVQATATSSGSVSDVETVFTTCGATTTPGNCVNFETPESSSTPAGANILTERNLDGQNGDPAAVPYAPGQVISVTVTISFQ